MITISRFLAIPFIYLIKIYRIFISPLLGGNCRHTPTCSEYGIIALKKHGVFKGSFLREWVPHTRHGGGCTNHGVFGCKARLSVNVFACARSRHQRLARFPLPCSTKRFQNSRRRACGLAARSNAKFSP